MSTLAQLGEIAKAAKQEDESHLGRKMFAAGTGTYLTGAGLALSGQRAMKRTEGPVTGRLVPGTKRLIGGGVLGRTGATLGTLGIGAGIANITHKKLTQRKKARSEWANKAARTRDRNARIERALGAR